MRTIRGSIVLPPDAPLRTCGSLAVEVRDVSVLDAPSTLVSRLRMDEVALVPNGRVAFDITIPDTEDGQALSLRVHGSLDGSEQVKPGDLLTTTSCPVPGAQTDEPMTVPVKVI